MNIKALVPLILAVALGLIAAIAGWQMTKHPATTTSGPAGAQVVVLSEDVPPGAELQPGQLALSTIGTPSVPQGAFTRIDQVVGRVPMTAMVKGQPVFETLLAERGSGTGLAALVPPGMRAISVEVNEFSGVGHLLTPGCRVDVVVTMPVEQGHGVLTRTICQNLQVTAVGRQLSAPQTQDQEQPPHSVTLLATPEQVQLIELACSTSRPRLVLRANKDQAMANMPGVTLAELRGKGPEPRQAEVRAAEQPATRPVEQRTVAAVPAITYRTVQIIRGSTESTVTFEDRTAGTLSTLSVAP